MSFCLLPSLVRLVSLLSSIYTRRGQTTARGPNMARRSFILAAGTYTNLNSHSDLSGRSFFPLEIMDGSDFQKNRPQRCKIGIKNEVKTFYFGDHIRTWTVISKRFSPCFPISVGPAASTVFPNLALRVKSLPTPDHTHFKPSRTC